MAICFKEFLILYFFYDYNFSLILIQLPFMALKINNQLLLLWLDDRLYITRGQPEAVYIGHNCYLLLCWSESCCLINYLINWVTIEGDSVQVGSDCRADSGSKSRGNREVLDNETWTSVRKQTKWASDLQFQVLIQSSSGYLFLIVLIGGFSLIFSLLSSLICNLYDFNFLGGVEMKVVASQDCHFPFYLWFSITCMQ